MSATNSVIKSLWRILALLSLVVLTACVQMPPSASQPAQAPRSVAVTGEAEVRVAPDEVIITFGIETDDKDLAAAKLRNDERLKGLLAFATGLGIEAKHIQTDQISIEPRYRDSYEKRDFIGYFVRKSVVITLKDVGKFESLLSGALEGGVNYVHGIEFRTTELRKHRDEARALAIKAAQEKATALAAELGQKAGRPQTIQEEQSNWWSGYSWWGARWGSSMTQNVVQNAVGGGASSDEATIAPGQIVVNARVSVTFDLE